MTQQKPEMVTRTAAVTGSLNAEERTVQVIFASEQPVRRYSWEDGPYDEILLCKPENVDLTRADNMSLLDSHGAYSLDDRLGSIVPGSIRFEKGQVIATVKLSRRAKAEELFQDIQDGMSLPISVGYKIQQEERTEAEAGGVAVVRALKWQPMEISVVPVPADPTAKTRSENTMPQQDNTTTQPERAAPTNVINERRRISELRWIARTAGVSDADLDAAIDNGETIDAFRSRAFDTMIERQGKTPTFPMVETRGMGGTDERYEQQVRARQDSIIARMTGSAPEGHAREFMNASLIDHARGLLDAQGINTRGMTREELLGYRGRSFGMHTTSDFPMLLQGAGERVIQTAYQAAQSPLKTLLSRASTATDFRAKSKLKVSDGGLLEKVNESGEIKSMTRGEAAESYKIDSYGRIFALSFQAIVNDDLGAFSDWSVQAGQMAALTENKILLDLLLANGGHGPVMGEDDKRLFDADHGNLAVSGSALSEASLAAAILAFRKQKALGGHRIAVAPKYLLVGPELEITAQKLVASISATTTAEAVPEAIKALIPIVEPNLDGKAWRIFAGPAAAPVFEHAYLSGHEGVQLSTREGFDRLGTEFRAVLHFGAGAVDYRGAYLNQGA
ncbi:HK97 family phage prohead protease [Pseudochrobactrum algeriensis]|uniref:prohead protease/major capsid protein fusion protein n=1 Tax=Pseudochrobactrum algeriensis TaxID=2834768 RepID=UPI001BD15609|nr:prohead protease/major capsid protein fusion protein [Pseudochrobactrum algeriensis]QVQ38163.1 HK97 family phage prohead protease [Pseudochrobactrum algeriensis]QVQ41389.1 HK97 family phage prohead protease [Pseudochrobactrum algeriensis]QVQ45311.1 HK97 family phage prohead protease [Pseudochrobactrum algeriensis]